MYLLQLVVVGGCFSIALWFAASSRANPHEPIWRAPVTGPLRVHPTNPRYFSDGNGRIVYLTGSHTWTNLQNAGDSDPPLRFRYGAYLDFLQAHNHNFFRLWAWEQAQWTNETSDNYWITPAPFQRVGPGIALDGKPKFDVSRFDEAYFGRLRRRVIAAGQRGFYVAVVLFNGWSIEKAKGSFNFRNPWEGHPFNRNNNINGIDGDQNNDNSGSEIHTLKILAVTAIQESYVRKVVDTLNDLDNVLFEISNESHQNSQAWQYHMIAYIKNYEATKPKQHPVGMTVEWPGGDNAELFASPADWISPNDDGGYKDDPPAADGSKVIIADTDHLWGIGGDRQWVWKSFLRGLHPIFMDGYDGKATGMGGAGFDTSDPTWISLRHNMGYTLAYARRIDLAMMVPRGDLVSTDYCLANPSERGAEYLAYLPIGGAITIDLTATREDLIVEWFDPNTGVSWSGGTSKGGTRQAFTAPFTGDAVLYIYASQDSASRLPR
jgi:hypothetical protein